ncbi:hypothetical protein [Methylobacter sp.]|uniref:hypothetical protein n=1 Tax=Methylobacter sp. TaxID=2051955 RepID=UPI002FDDC9F6
MIENKAIIIIAVSKYNGPYSNLPGTVTSARRLREWAEQTDEDCNYNVLYLADDEYDEINVQLVREKVTEFLNNNLIDRLIVYFAGHGIARSAGDQFWLLTDAANDLREGINVESFRRGLLKCNIGAYNDEQPGQLCIIGDACRNTGRDAIDFSGDPILTSTAKMNRRIQLDRFLSTGLGDYSFQIDSVGSQNAYCLFSEVMLGALRGEAKEAIETEDHRFKPAVTNHKLADYLQKEVTKRTAAIDEDMEPDLLTGIHPPYNFYKLLKEPLPKVMPSSDNPQLAEAIRMAAFRSPEKDRLSKVQEHQRQTLLQGKRHIEEVFETFKEDYEYRHFFPDFHRRDFSTICDFSPDLVAVPNGASVAVQSFGLFYRIIVTHCEGGAPILIRQGDQWLLTPYYPNVITVIFRDLPGDTLFYCPGRSRWRERERMIDSRHRAMEWISQWTDWDTYLSDFSNLDNHAPLRAADANKFADRIRIGKEEFPHQSVTAGYLYEFSNDYANIARTAHYMERNTGTVPFDLALLCVDKIEWRREDNKLVAFADLPAVERSKPTDKANNRPNYAYREFEALKGVRLWGIAPIFSQGWSFMQTELYLEIPESIRQIGKMTSGRSASSLTEEGLTMFLETFDYRIVETNSPGSSRIDDVSGSQEAEDW